MIVHDFTSSFSASLLEELYGAKTTLFVVTFFKSIVHVVSS